ncbi:MAG: hypothetical protein ACXWT4_14765 [Methylobacter sp.]
MEDHSVNTEQKRLAECGNGILWKTGQQMNLYEVAREISKRLEGIFLPDANERRPLYGDVEKFQTDLHWREHLIFPEYFHGDTGRRSEPVTKWDGPVWW